MGLRVEGLSAWPETVTDTGAARDVRTFPKEGEEMVVTTGSGFEVRLQTFGAMHVRSSRVIRAQMLPNVRNSGCRGAGCRVQGLECRVWGAGCRVLALPALSYEKTLANVPILPCTDTTSPSPPPTTLCRDGCPCAALTTIYESETQVVASACVGATPSAAPCV